MIYAKIHTYKDTNGVEKQTVISSTEPLDGAKQYDVGSHEHLEISKGRIVVKADDTRSLEEKQKQLEVILRQRQAEYPPMTDYLDAVVKGDKKAIKKYIDDCQAVKEKYPKPE